MRSLLSFLVFAATFFAWVEAAPQVVLPPSKDPFYQPPANYSEYKPGEVIKKRLSPHKLRSIYLEINVKTAWQLMYRTTDGTGNATYAVTTLIEPYNANNSRLVQYLIAQDSSLIDCPASYSFQYGASMLTVVAQVEMYLIQIALNQGWWVNTPDYEGPEAAFTAGRLSGHAVLDLLRAAIHVGETEDVTLKKKTDVVFWGYLGGSLAAGWAAGLQRLYAPELTPQLLGACLGGFPANITHTILAIDGSLYAGMLGAGITGLSRQYPILKQYIKKALPKAYNWVFGMAADACLFPACAYMAYAKVFQGENRWVPTGLDVFREPDVVNALYNNTMGVSKDDMPQIPIFLYQGRKDNIVPAVNADILYEQWSKMGIKLFELTILNTTRHITEAALGAPAAVAWITNRFEHKPPVEGCLKTERYSNLLYPGVAPAVVELVQAAGKLVFGFEIGPDTLNGTLFKREDGQPMDYDDVVEKRIHEEHMILKKRGSIPGEFY